eukprot:8148867-Alexandrium_andersonii.AAC.1
MRAAQTHHSVQTTHQKGGAVHLVAQPQNGVVRNSATGRGGRRVATVLPSYIKFKNRVALAGWAICARTCIPGLQPTLFFVLAWWLRASTRAAFSALAWQPSASTCESFFALV